MDLEDKKLITKNLFLHDLSYKTLLAGCDEAGRGPLAGPVVCAACIMPLDKSYLDGINDSKALTEKRREILFESIVKTALTYSIAVVDCKTIDEINILRATRRGMNEAINGLKTTPQLVLVDAVSGLDINTKYTPIIKGDATSYNIAAASILAKVYRDRLMREYDQDYPEYGFAQNKGYATRQHITALKKFGPSPLHRKLFIRNALSQQLQFTILD